MITIKSGMNITPTYPELHPLKATLIAIDMVDSDQDHTIETNSTDFISAVVNYSDKKLKNYLLLYDGEELDIDAVFSHLNEGFKILHNKMELDD